MRPSQERQLGALEASYRELLLSALQTCAKGRWGLFAHNERWLSELGPKARAHALDPAVDELLELGAKIERLRRKLALEAGDRRVRALIYDVIAATFLHSEVGRSGVYSDMKRSGDGATAGRAAAAF